VVGAVSLKRDGHLVGRALSECTITDATFKGQQCTLDLVLQRGVITAKTDGTITIIHGATADTFVVRLSD
jgi:hypothetical protein